MNPDRASDEKQIMDERTRLQVRPSPQAYQRMSHAPWFSSDNRYYRKQTPFTSDNPASHAPTSLVHDKSGYRGSPLTIAAAVLLIITLAVLVWATPPLRTLAQDILDRLFKRAPENALTLVLDSAPRANVPVSVAETFGSVASAEGQTGMSIHEPELALVPHPLTGVTINYVNATVWLIFADSTGYLSIYQRSADQGWLQGWLDEGVVGKDALIIPVTIKSVTGTEMQGEYVQGGWALEETTTPSADNKSRSSATWTTETGQRRLRWRDQETVYEMMALDRNLSLAEMIKIAASMR